MNDELNNMDDLLDDNIDKSLRELGFIFPRTSEDFKRLDDQVKKNSMALTERLQNPYSFLGKRAFTHMRKEVQNQSEYSQQLAQAARDGKTISDDIKKRMAEDKRRSSEKKKEK